MRTEDKSYYEYMASRSRASLLLRKFFYRSVIGEFSGKMLDVGSGVGEFLRWYPRAVGIDTNPYLVRRCKEGGLRCSLGAPTRYPSEAGPSTASCARTYSSTLKSRTRP